MPPGTRRANRGAYAEHDDFEGLPVRQWRYDWANVTTQPPHEQHQQNDIWAVELPHGMPKDSHLLPPHSQELLRAARSGRLYRRPPMDDDDIDADAVMPDKLEKKDDEKEAQGFSTKLWKQVPRNVEAPTVSYLAKRRPGTVTIASKTVVDDKPSGPTVTRATVRRIDAAGNPYTEDVTLVEGQPVQGEIIATRVEAVAGAQGDSTVSAAPSHRRKAAPSKRKSKAGPGRGKKKMRMSATDPRSAPGPAPAVDSLVAPIKAENQGENVRWLFLVHANASGSTDPKRQGIHREDTGTPNPDSEMADGDGDGDGDDDDDDDDEEGAGDGDDNDGDRDEGATRSDQQHETNNHDRDHVMTDAAPLPFLQHPAEPDSREPPMPPESLPPNPLTLAPPAASLASGSPRPEGSPLKNVISSSSPEANRPPTVVSPSPPPPPPVRAEETTADSTMAQPPSPPPAREELQSLSGRGDAEMEAPSGQPTPSERSPLGNAPAWPGRRTSEDPVKEEALLPPPHDQVGNIDSPRAESGLARSLVDDEDNKGRQDEGSSGSRPGYEDEAEAEGLQRQSPHQYDSIMTEDTIKPDDSASVRFPQSGPPSDVGTASVGAETKYSAKETTASMAKPASPTMEVEEEEREEEEEGHAGKEDEEPDLVGGLMSALDREVADGVDGANGATGDGVGLRSPSPVPPPSPPQQQWGMSVEEGGPRGDDEEQRQQQQQRQQENPEQQQTDLPAARRSASQHSAGVKEEEANVMARAANGDYDNDVVRREQPQLQEKSHHQHQQEHEQHQRQHQEQQQQQQQQQHEDVQDKEQDHQQKREYQHVHSMPMTAPEASPEKTSPPHVTTADANVHADADVHKDEEKAHAHSQQDSTTDADTNADAA